MSETATKLALTEKLVGNLVRLVYSHNYPLQYDIGFLAFKEGVEKAGGVVALDREAKEMSVHLHMYSPQMNEGFSYQGTIQYNQIFRGSGKFPVSSVGALHSASRMFFDFVNRNIPINKRDRITIGTEVINKNAKFLADTESSHSPEFQYAQWNSILRIMHQKSMAAINAYISEQVRERRENALLHRTLRTETDIRGSHMERILERENLDFYEAALELDPQKVNYGGVISSVQLLDRDWGRFNNKPIFPSPETFEKFFWGLYLHRLKCLKGYEPLCEDARGPEALLIVKQDAGLKKGGEMTWGAEYSPE